MMEVCKAINKFASDFNLKNWWKNENFNKIIRKICFFICLLYCQKLIFFNTFFIVFFNNEY